MASSSVNASNASLTGLEATKATTLCVTQARALYHPFLLDSHLSMSGRAGGLYGGIKLSTGAAASTNTSETTPSTINQPQTVAAPKTPSTNGGITTKAVETSNAESEAATSGPSKATAGTAFYAIRTTRVIEPAY
jgi:hypothetical protein